MLVDFLRHQLGFARVLVLVRTEDGGHRRRRGVGRRPDRSPRAGRQRRAGRRAARLVRKLDGGVLAAQLPDARNVVVAPLLGDDEPLGLVAAEWSRGAARRASLASPCRR